MAVESAVLEYRLGRVENKADDLDRTKADQTIVDEVKEDLKGIRKLLITFMITVASSAVMVSLTLLITVGTKG